MVDNKCKRKNPETKEKIYFCLNVSIYSRTCIFHIYTSSLIITSNLMLNIYIYTHTFTGCETSKFIILMKRLIMNLSVEFVMKEKSMVMW